MESEDLTHTGSSQAIAHDALQRGIAAARSGDRDAAYRAFNEALASHAGDPELWVWLGATSPTLDQAEAAFERAYYLDPNNVEASMGIRWVRLRRKAATVNLVREPASAHKAGAPAKRARPRTSRPWPWVTLNRHGEASSWRRTVEAFVPLGLLVLIAVMGAALVTFSNSVGGPALVATSTPVAQVAGLQGGDATPAPTQRPTATKTRITPTFTPTSTSSPSATHSPTGTPTPPPTDTPIPTATPAPPPTPAPPATITYVVQPGDTLGTIAFRHGVTVDALRQANALTSDNLFVGQVLSIPVNR